MVVFPVNHVIVEDSVCKMNPSGLHNGSRLAWYWALLLCLFVLATSPYPDLRAKLAQQSFIQQKTTWQRRPLSARSFISCFTVFIYWLVVTVYEWKYPHYECPCSVLIQDSLFSMFSTVEKRDPQFNGQVWEMGCWPPNVRGGLKTESREKGKEGSMSSNSVGTVSHLKKTGSGEECNTNLKR